MARILVIDDDPEIVTTLEMALGDIHQVFTAHSGRAGLKLLKENEFDVVITDIFMPEVDGFEIIMQVNTMHPRPYVIAMSGYTGRYKFNCMSDVAAALGVQQVLYKPFSIRDLLKTVSRYEARHGAVENENPDITADSGAPPDHNAAD